MEEERKKKKKENSTELQKPNVDAGVDPANKGNIKLYLPEQNYLNHKLENKMKARCQVGNKAMKTNKNEF